MLATAPTFRPWRADDLGALVRHANNPKVAQNLKDRFPAPYTWDDGRQWLDRNAAPHPDWRSFTIDVDGEASGGVLVEVGADIFRRTADISYWVAEPLWGRQIGSAAARFATEIAFAEFDVVRVQALVFEWNPASCRVLEKTGFEREARLRRAVTKGDRTGDLFIYAKLRGA